MSGYDLEKLSDCNRCPRLAGYMSELEPAKGRQRVEYWNRPVPGFGDPAARVFLLGLAPGAHGANRTGRPFTGDGAGDFMYPLLHAAGFASQPQAEHSGDGLTLQDLYISNAVKCVPPQNKPQHIEFRQCRPFLAAEQKRLKNLKVVMALGRGAFDSYLRLCQESGIVERAADYPFAHAACYQLPTGLWVVACYHTSRYNVNTGRINAKMFMDLLRQVRILAENG
ncbi:uracil-DNA glycosylase [Syntrophotalea acetylenica]|uniref:uracil-DNA glycosylase n=1 Tax=Syntrophotalea TaxID=2812025 RepID=UPI002A3697D1|nr:uracil-DNA glycosylase [Syntrophotalea acetylenica]MDY0261879.1 uracil-DNA glycosylase [Syntrophotalea acetylenica]